MPSALDDIIAARAASGRPLPRAVYAIPSGQNPTGAAMGPARRAEIYEVARARDLVIIEDDAYAWLQYPRGEGDVPGLSGLQRESRRRGRRGRFDPWLGGRRRRRGFERCSGAAKGRGCVVVLGAQGGARWGGAGGCAGGAAPRC